MENVTLARRLVAELIGTAMLVCAVVGSGIMAERLASGAPAVILLANTIATGAALVTLILTFAPVSGAHFNPVVSVVSAFNNELSWKDALAYSAVQVAGGVAGVALANLMFDLPAFVMSTKVRTGEGIWLGETVAAFGLVGLIIAASRRHAIPVVAASVSTYITAAYWFTSSTSFANPAVTIARAMTDTFTGIRLTDVPAFIAAQFVGGFVSAFVFNWLIPKKHE